MGRKKLDPFIADTRKWIRGKSDECAVANGCRFNAERGIHACNWIEEHCCLYEGDYAGKPIVLMPWQRDCLMRLFSWERFSVKWNRWVRRYKKLSLWVSKKNGKSPLLAAIGTYLTFGDGEQGQKFFFCALDGKQAQIAFTHAIEMVSRSPKLNSFCNIIRSSGNQRIVYEEKSSFMAILAGDNVKGQEGLNGSLGVDEVHCVSTELMNVVKYAGASRSEPLHVEVSTAGNDPESYGYAKYKEGQANDAQETPDESLLFIDYSAPIDLSESELDSRILEIGKQANPSWGVTIDPDEFLREYNTAKRVPSELASFKMYRLNIWQNSSNPWLPAAAWQNCARKFNARQLIRRDVFGGLDLSKVSDMSAFALAIPGPNDIVELLIRLWIPEAYAKRHNHIVPFLKWAEEGYLTLTPGDTMDYNLIRREIFRLSKFFRIQEIGYDPLLAEDVTQQLSEGWYSNEGICINEGIGCQRIEFSQTHDGMAEAVETFEGLIVDEKLRHGNNPVLNWMAGHCEIKIDANNKKRPVKPGQKQDSVKKIDGILAAIMACARATKMRETCAYDTRGVTFLS